MKKNMFIEITKYTLGALYLLISVVTLILVYNLRDTVDKESVIIEDMNNEMQSIQEHTNNIVDQSIDINSRLEAIEKELYK